MPEIHNNNPDNIPSAEQNQPNIERNFENRVNFESTQESNVENLQSVVETPVYNQAEQHIKQVVEVQKNIHQSNPIQKPLNPKIQEKYNWLLSIPEEHRVEVAVKLITTKGKDILEVINAFLAIEDYIALDNLEESLSSIYPTLIDEGLLPDVHDK